jgi:hypothetical protein
LTLFLSVTYSPIQSNHNLAGYDNSTKQVLDSDRMIRVLSLPKFSCISLLKLDSAIQSGDSDPWGPSVDDGDADDLNEKLSSCSPSTSNLNILFYISGYAA